MQLISGVSVIVQRPVTQTGTDDMSEPIIGQPISEPVDNVLFDPTAASNLSDALRLKNIEVDADFHFPKSYTGSLRGCSIAYGGHSYSVIGDIRRYIEADTPGMWNGIVSAKEVS